MPGDRRSSRGRSPRTPYPTQRGRRVQPGTPQQRTIDHYFPVRNIVPAPPPPPPPPDTGIDALPQTVLRDILAMLSAVDLLLRANRVCRQWRNIIADDGFCQWKKRYLRYHRQGEAGNQEVISILQENHMTSDDYNNLCLLHMAKYMSQTFRTDRDRGRDERILACIRGHHLYEQARACVPEAMKQTGEDPWSALALMLVLADGVGDVWQLVACLRTPLTPEQLSEFLWCTATLLRAMADKHVNISNRLHYNIFFVLHLMENVLPSNRSEEPLMDNYVPSDRPPSPAPSCVSMRSDQSMLDPINFSSEPVPSVVKPPSPAPSCESMKSDQSMPEPFNFSSEPVPSGLNKSWMDGQGSQICGENQLTQEQKQIMNHNTERDHVVKIMAFAGTGKTTTLVCYAQQRPELHFLYVVFNKAVQKQAKRIFPGNVSCKTIHGLAHASVGQRYREKLRHSSLNLFSVFAVMPDGERSIVWAKVVTKTINKFWASTDQHIDAQHVPEWYKNTKGDMCRPTKDQKAMFLKHARHIWEKMKEVEPTSVLAYRMYHDGYLKLWQLEGAQMEHYDVIFIDEAQDCTPVTMDILMSQPCAKILVGDPHQHIYSFRGAINNLDMIQHTHIYYLTQSFRFGPEIAYVGATILEVGKRVRKTLVGGGQRGSVQGQDTEMCRRFRTGVGGADGRLAVLSRTNFSIFDEAVRLINLEPTSRIYIIGGIQAFGMSKIQDIWALKQNLQIKDHFIRRFRENGVEGLTGYRGLCQYAEITENQEDGLSWKIAVVEKYGEQIPDLLERIHGRHQTRQQKADFILGTMHKAKGLEFDTVAIVDDFRALQALPAQEHGGNQSPVEDDDWNLLYMAVTRAKRTLFMTRTITDILARAGEYFLRSKLITVPAESPPPQCSTERCSNPINTNTRLSMHRLPITYVDGREKGGTVCLACVNRMAGHLAFLMSPGIERVPFP